MATSHETPGDRDAGEPAGPLAPAVITTDRDGVITSCDGAAQRLLGCRADDAVGRSLMTFYDPVEVVARAATLGISAGWDVIAAAARGSASEPRQWTCVRPGGERVRTWQTVMTLRAAGRDAGFVCVATETVTGPSPAAARNGTSEAMLAVFDASPVATVITRAVDGRILYANHACLELLGWLEGGFVGRSTLEVGFWARPGRREAMMQKLARDGFVRDLEEDVRTRGGETRTVLTSVSCLVFDGEPSLIGHIHDITRRRRLEQQLRESEERFRQVTEIYQQGFVLTDVDPPRVLYASPAVARIFGVDLETLYRDPLAIQKLVHPDEKEGLLARRLAMTVATDLEYRIVRPDGRTRWIRTRAQPVTMKDGRLARIAGVSEDVTAEHELHAALRESEELFRLLAENSTDVIGRLSADQRIEYVSPASRSVYGYEPEAMIGRYGWEFVHPDYVAAEREDFSARPDRQGVITNTYRVLREDGSDVYVEAKIRALRDPETGEVVEFHTVARDVGERRRAEIDVRRAKEEAELANAAKSEFLSRMSHELRTPLHAILGFGELLARGDLQAQQREQLTQITRAGAHLLELINEVLDLSRIEDGGLHLSLEHVHVGQVVGETLEMLGPAAAEHAVSLVVPQELELYVLADRQRLKQALLNLLSNAVKYNSDGGEVRVAATRRDAASARVRIEVADTGIGIAADDLARAFAAFERLGAETTDVEGTGLGLALTRRLVDAMGGAIGVESEVGRGTTFWLDLPEVSAPAARPAKPARVPATPAASARTDARSVLYIEDNPSNIKLVEAILRERPQVTLLVAQQGSFGLELAREHMPALVLLDLNLPDVSGEEVLRRLRGDPRTAGIPVVMVSADATAGRRARLRAAGAQAYLTKPFQIEQFLAVIDEAPAALEPAPGARPDGPPSGEPPVTRTLDHSTLDRLRGLYPDGTAVGELIEIYLHDSPGRLAALATAAAARDPEAVRSAAHAWRGACGVTGAHRLVALLDDIETLARIGAIPDEQQLAEVRGAFEEARAALAAQLP
jgi:PAS domain S-box-containing protein